jgi:hypothetical protein
MKRLINAFARVVLPTVLVLLGSASSAIAQLSVSANVHSSPPFVEGQADAWTCCNLWVTIDVWLDGDGESAHGYGEGFNHLSVAPRLPSAPDTFYTLTGSACVSGDDWYDCQPINESFTTPAASVPSISSIDPSSGVRGQCSAVSVYGDNLYGAVAYSDQPGVQLSVTAAYSNQITGTVCVDVNAPNSAQIWVQTGAGSSNSITFSVIDP